MVTGMALRATGKVRARIPERTTTRTLFTGKRDRRPNAAVVIESSLDTMWNDFMSFGETQGMVPSVQKDASDFEGVPPPNEVVISFRLVSDQPNGRYC